MISHFHFLRPWWLLTCLLLFALIGYLWRQNPQSAAWMAICDKPLLDRLLQTKGKSKRHGALLLLLMSVLCMIISLAGPTWSALSVPTYRQVQPRVIVLDMSPEMLSTDLLPDRLSRTKFKLHDLFKYRDRGQFGLLVYTGEPFVVSPLTDDAQTIDALLSSLSPDIMPVEGRRLDIALEEGGRLITQAGFKRGQILVLTGEPPDLAAITVAKNLANQHIDTSIMPVIANKTINPLFVRLAEAGQGQLLPFDDNSSDLEQWLRKTTGIKQFSYRKQDDIPMWIDEGRWFLLPALLLLMPVFRRGWLQRITS